MMVIQKATAAQADEILRLYHSFDGGPAGWDEEYPNREFVCADLSRGDLFVGLDERGAVAAAVSIDHEEEVDELSCWPQGPLPFGFLSRLCVRADLQGHGFAGQMLNYAFGELQSRGMKSVRMLVHQANTGALAMYLHMGFTVAGECELFDKYFTCIQRDL